LYTEYDADVLVDFFDDLDESEPNDHCGSDESLATKRRIRPEYSLLRPFSTEIYKANAGHAEECELTDYFKRI
jgi:hypothetical protein